MAGKNRASIWESDGYPPAAFYFKVIIDGNQQGDETSFQEVSGIGPERQTEEVVEGGRLPSTAVGAQNKDKNL